MRKSQNQIRESVRQWVKECRAFFNDTAVETAQRNWETLHIMTVLYLVYLGSYLFIVCPTLRIPLQTSTVAAFTIIHTVFTLWVFIRGKKAPSVWVVDLAITLFAAQILGLSGFLGVVIFPTEASFLFPLCLVLMTQIYTRRPIYPILEVLIPSAAYLVCCWLTKGTYYFILDAVSISIAIAIAGAALYSVTIYKMRAYQAQTALQKMCALDPMTHVNNKPTFEFLVEDYLRHNPNGRHALAICDFDSFKSINDNHGHRMGDKVLNAFADQLHQLADPTPDLIAGRFGGDEFVLFFKNYTSKQEVLRQLKQIESVPGFDFPVTITIGVSFSHTGNADFVQYFSAADHGLYRAKTERTRMRITDADAILSKRPAE